MYNHPQSVRDQPVSALPEPARCMVPAGHPPLVAAVEIFRHHKPDWAV